MCGQPRQHSRADCRDLGQPEEAISHKMLVLPLQHKEPGKWGCLTCNLTRRVGARVAGVIKRGWPAGRWVGMHATMSDSPPPKCQHPLQTSKESTARARLTSATAAKWASRPMPLPPSASSSAAEPASHTAWNTSRALLMAVLSDMLLWLADSASRVHRMTQSRCLQSNKQYAKHVGAAHAALSTDSR